MVATRSSCAKVVHDDLLAPSHWPLLQFRDRDLDANFQHRSSVSNSSETPNKTNNSTKKGRPSLSQQKNDINSKNHCDVCNNNNENNHATATAVVVVDDDELEDSGAEMTRRGFLWRFVVAVCTISLAWYLYRNYHHHFTLNALRDQRRSLKAYVDKHPRDSMIYYISLFVLVVSLNLPGATVLSFAGGLCFTQPWATIYSVLGCSVGATTCFVLAKAVFGDFLRRAVSTRSYVFRRMRVGLRKNQFLYMIFMRFMIIVPFWFVNVSSAILGVTLKTFFFSTSIAVIPGSFLYTTFGVVLADVFESRENLDDLDRWTMTKVFFTHPDMSKCFVLLGVCVVIPVALYVMSQKASTAKRKHGHHHRKST